MEKKNEPISFDEFKKVTLQAGKIIKAEGLEGYNKILRIQVDLGSEKREIMSGLAKHYSPEELIGKNVIVCTNLEPKKFGENISNGMILAVEKNNKPILLTSFEDVEPGSQVL